MFCVSTESVRIIEKGLLENLRLLEVFADISAVPTVRVEGIKLEGNVRKMASGSFGIGALTIGKLKYHVKRTGLQPQFCSSAGTEATQERTLHCSTLS